MNRSASSARVVAVTSGKGGVGKTNIAVNLAIALAERELRVILWDLDLGLANAQVLLNLDAAHDSADVVQGRLSLREVMVEAYGIRVIPGASGDEHLANLDERARRSLISGLKDLIQDSDFVVMDTGAGIARNTVRFAAAADDILVVTTPEPTAMLDAYAMIKLVHQEAPWAEIRLVVNMARDQREAIQAVRRMGSMAQSFIQAHVEPAGILLQDPVVGEAVRHRRPFLVSAPDSQASAAVRRLADSLALSAGAQLAKPPQGGGFLDRLMARLG